MHREPTRVRPLPTMALMGLAVALPLTVAAESGAAFSVRAETVASQRADSVTWADRFCEAARNLCPPQLAVLPAADVWEDVLPLCDSADAPAASRPAHLRPIELTLIDLPPPALA